MHNAIPISHVVHLVQTQVLDPCIQTRSFAESMRWSNQIDATRDAVDDSVAANSSKFNRVQYLQGC